MFTILRLRSLMALECSGISSTATLRTPMYATALHDRTICVADTRNHCLKVLDCVTLNLVRQINLEPPLRCRSCSCRRCAGLAI